MNKNLYSFMMNKIALDKNIYKNICEKRCKGKVGMY